MSSGVSGVSLRAARRSVLAAAGVGVLVETGESAVGAGFEGGVGGFEGDGGGELGVGLLQVALAGEEEAEARWGSKKVASAAMARR